LRLTIYSKPGCHLCDEMKAVVNRVIVDHSDVTLEEIDISADRELVARYGIEIPVLLIDGRKATKYRLSEDQLRRMIRAKREGAADPEGS